MHFLADGTLDPAFRPDVAGGAGSLVRRGDTLYAAGATFHTPAGEPHRGLAALDARTGRLLDWTGGVTDGGVAALSLDGDRLYLAGTFSHVDGESRSNVAAVNVDTGALEPWAPRVDGSVDDIAARAGVVVIAGPFDRVQGKERYGAVALRADATLLPDLDVRNTTAVAVTDQALIVAGTYSGRVSGLAAFDPATGARLPWFDDVTGVPSALATDGNRLYTSAGDVFDGGTRLAFKLAAAAGVLAVEAGTVAAGGRLGTIIGGRRNVAAIDLASGALLPFTAAMDGSVGALAKAGGTLFVGGSFKVPQGNLAALDAQSGAALPGVVPSTTGWVGHLALSGSRLFVGGWMTKLGSQTVYGLGAVDLTTGEVLNWAPVLACEVRAMVVVANTLYVGSCIPGGPDYGLAAFDATTLARLPLPASSGGSVFALADDGAGGVWVGGRFSTLGETPSPNLARLDAAGLVHAAPPVDGVVTALALKDGVLYLAADGLRHIAGARRLNAGAFTVADGAVTPFRPDPDDAPRAFAPLLDGGLLMGGSFSMTTLVTVSGLARFPPAGAGAAPVTRELPRLAGDVFTDGTLRVLGGTWDGEPSGIDANWLRCDAQGEACVPDSATAWSRTIRPADSGHRFRVELIASNDAGAGPLAVTAPGPLMMGPRPDVIYGASPMIWGIPRPGTTLGLDPGIWQPEATAYHYRWERCTGAGVCTGIGAPDAPSYTLAAADLGFRVQVLVSGVGAAGTLPGRSSNTVGPVLSGTPSGHAPFVNTPTLSSPIRVGDLTVASGGGDQGTSEYWTWSSCDASGNDCAVLPGHNQAHLPVPADEGRRLRVSVVAYGPDGVSTERTSALGAIVQPGPVPTPTPTPIPTPTPTPTATPTPTPTATPTPAPTPTAKPARSAAPDLTSMPSPVQTLAVAPPRTATSAGLTVRLLARRGRALVRLQSPVARRVTVRLRLVGGRRTLARTTVSLRAHVRRELTMTSRRGRLVAEVTWPGGRVVSAPLRL